MSSSPADFLKWSLGVQAPGCEFHDRNWMRSEWGGGGRLFIIDVTISYINVFNSYATHSFVSFSHLRKLSKLIQGPWYALLSLHSLRAIST